MSTRGTKNEDVGRSDCRKMASWLRGEAGHQVFEEHTKRWVIEALEAIADGADPAEVLFSGRPEANDRFAIRVSADIQQSMNLGMTQGQACRALATVYGMSYSRVLKIWQRHRHEIDPEIPYDY